MRSAEAAARLDWPDRLDDAVREPAAHADVAVVQVDRRVAMAGHEPDGLPERREARRRRPGLRPDHAVLVAAVGPRPLALPEARRAGIERVRLVAGVDHRVRRAAADDPALDE